MMAAVNDGIFMVDRDDDDNKWWDLHCAAEEGASDYEIECFSSNNICFSNTTINSEIIKFSTTRFVDYSNLGSA